MAINFSASLAACLAAGLKVPRQIMYCISQDTGAPYVLYKDSQDTVERGGTIGDHWGSVDVYPNLQQNTQTQITAQNTAQITATQTPQSPPNLEGLQHLQQQQQQQQQIQTDTTNARELTSPERNGNEIEKDISQVYLK